MGFFSKTLDKLKGALKKTAEVLNTDVRTLFIPGRQINDEFLAEMEEKFLRADLGVKNVERIVGEVRERVVSHEASLRWEPQATPGSSRRGRAAGA